MHIAFPAMGINHSYGLHRSRLPHPTFGDGGAFTYRNRLPLRLVNTLAAALQEATWDKQTSSTSTSSTYQCPVAIPVAGHFIQHAQATVSESQLTITGDVTKAEHQTHNRLHLTIQYTPLPTPTIQVTRKGISFEKMELTTVDDSITAFRAFNNWQHLLQKLKPSGELTDSSSIPALNVLPASPQKLIYTTQSDYEEAVRNRKALIERVALGLPLQTSTQALQAELIKRTTLRRLWTLGKSDAVRKDMGQAIWLGLDFNLKPAQFELKKAERAAQIKAACFGLAPTITPTQDWFDLAEHRKANAIFFKDQHTKFEPDAWIKTYLLD